MKSSLKYTLFLLNGILFGIIMTKSEAVSWYRIQEMFRFQDFHMYGIIGTAVVVGVLLHQLIRWMGWRNADGSLMQGSAKQHIYKANFLGGSVFGMGWAMTGACPGPLYVLVGQGYFIILVVIASAVVGTWAYGMLRHRLPH